MGTRASDQRRRFFDIGVAKLYRLMATRIRDAVKRELDPGEVNLKYGVQ